jgi:hypothetical protein
VPGNEILREENISIPKVGIVKRGKPDENGRWVADDRERKGINLPKICTLAV